MSIYYDAIPYLMSSSFYSSLSVSSMVVQFTVLHRTYSHKPVLILLICFTYLVGISQTVLYHIICVYSSPESHYCLIYPLAVSLESVTMQASSHVYKTLLSVSSQMVK